MAKVEKVKVTKAPKATGKSAGKTKTLDIETLKEVAVNDEATSETGLITVEQNIKNEIKKFNVADSEIAKLKKKYAGLKVADISDKAGRKKLKEAIREVSSARIGIDKKRVEIKEFYLSTGKAIDVEAKRLHSLFGDLETDLVAEDRRIEALVAEEKERAANEAAAALAARVDELKESGMAFDGSFYSIGGAISMDIVTIEKMKDEDFERLKLRVSEERERLDHVAAEAAAAAEQLRLDQEAEEQRIKDEREALELEKAEMQKLRDEQAAEIAEMKRLKEEAEQEKADLLAEIERTKQEAIQAEKDREAQIIQDQIDNRVARITALGFSYDNDSVFRFTNRSGSVALSKSTLVGLEGEEFFSKVYELELEVNNLISKADKEDKADAEAEKERILKEERDRVAAELAAEKERARLAKIAEKEKAEALPEIEKIENYFKSLNAVEIPEIKNKQLSDFLKRSTYSIGKEIEQSIKELQLKK